MISKNKYIILLWIINLINYPITYTSPLNHQIILKENTSSNIQSTTLDKNTLNQTIKYKTFKVVMVYILAIIGYLSPFKLIKENWNNKKSKEFIASIISIIIGLMALIYGWVTQQYIHNLIIGSYGNWFIYLFVLSLITQIPEIIDNINKNINLYQGINQSR